MGKNLIYLNNAATTWPKPSSVIKAVNDSLKIPYHEHGRAVIRGLTDHPKNTRQALCELFSAEKKDNFQFTSNATDSLNLLIQGFVMNQKKKTHAITTTLDHNSVLRPLNFLEKNKKVSLSKVDFDKSGKVSLNMIKQAIRPDTKLVVMTHASNVLGSLQDITQIGNYLKKQDIFFIVDAAQSAGHVKIDISKTAVDALVFTGHKSLFGYPGVGGFYIDDPKKVGTYKQGGTGVFSQYPLQPEEMPLKYETGTLNYPGIVSLNEGIRFIKNTGLRKIDAKTSRMSKIIIKDLARMDNIKIYNKDPKVPIISFNIEGVSNEDVGFILAKQFGITIRAGLHCAPLVHAKIDEGRGCVRASLSWFNTQDECRTFSEAVKKISESAPD